MPERFYDQDPNTGQKFYTQKGWNEWKPVPVETDPNTNEEYELWQDNWVKRAKAVKPEDEVPPEMPSIAQGGMAVAGSPNVGQARIATWAKTNPKKAKRAQEILAKHGKIDPSGAIGSELSIILSGEWDPGKPMDSSTLAKKTKENLDKELESKFGPGSAVSGEVDTLSGMSPWLKPLYVGGRAILSGVPTGVKGLVDIVRTIDDTIQKSGIGDYRTAPLHVIKQHVLDPLADSLDYTANTFQIKQTLDQAWGPKMKHWTEPLKPILDVPSLSAEMAPQLLVGNTAALKSAGEKAGEATFRALAKMGLPKALRSGVAESVAGAVTNAPQQIIMDSFNEWGSATQEIRSDLIAQGMPEEEATRKALYQTRNLLQQNLALNTMLSPLDAVSTIYGKTAMAKRFVAEGAKKGSKIARVVTGSLDALKSMASENFQERSQEALTMLAEHGEGWSYDKFVENFNSDRAKHAGAVGGAFGLAMHVGGEFAESRAKKRAVREDSETNAALQAGAEALRAEYSAPEGVAAPGSVAAELEAGVKPQDREAVQSMTEQVEPAVAPRPEGLATDLQPAFQEVTEAPKQLQEAPEFFGSDVMNLVQQNREAIPQPLFNRVVAELDQVMEARQAVDNLAEALMPTIERGQVEGASPNDVRSMEMALKNLNDAERKYQFATKRFDGLTRPEVLRRITQERSYATQERIQSEGGVQQYQQAEARGLPTEAVSGYRPGEGREVTQEAQVKPKKAKEPVTIRYKGEDGRLVTTKVDDPALIREFQKAVKQTDKAVQRIRASGIPKGEKYAAIKAATQQLAATKKDVVDRWQSTKEAVARASDITKAQDATSALVAFADIAVGIMKDLARMGKLTFENFMSKMREDPDFENVSQKWGLTEDDFRRIYDEQRADVGDGQIAPEESRAIGQRGFERSGVEVSRSDPGLRNIDASLTVHSQLNSWYQQFYDHWSNGESFAHTPTQHGDMYTAMEPDGTLNIAVNTGQRPWVASVKPDGNNLYVNVVHTGFSEAAAFAEKPQGEGFVPGGGRAMYEEMANMARAMGLKDLVGDTVGSFAYPLRMRYKGSRIVSSDLGITRMSTPVKSILERAILPESAIITKPLAELHRDYSNGKIDLKTLKRFTDDVIRDGVPGGVSYMASGINPFQVVDTFLDSIGRETLGKKLGIDWANATASDYIKAIVNAIGGLGSTVKATAAKIRSKIGGSVEDSTKIAQFLHDANDQGQIDINQYARSVRGAANSLHPDTFSAEIGKDVSQEMVKGLKNVTSNREFWSLADTLLGWGVTSDKALKIAKLMPSIGKLTIGGQLLALRTGGDYGRLYDTMKGLDAKRENVKARYGQPIIDAVSRVAGDELQARILGLALNIGTKMENPAGGTGVVFSEDQLRRAFKQIKPDTIKAYREAALAAQELSKQVLDSYLKRYQYKIDNLNLDLKKATTQSEEKRIREAIATEEKALERVKDVFSNKAYWPQFRKGDYFISWKVPGTDKSVAVIAVDWNPNSRAGKRQIAQGWEMAVQENPKLKELVANKQLDPMKDFESLDRSAQMEQLRKAGIEFFDHALFEALEAIGDVDPEVAKTVKDILDSKITGESIRAHMKRREGVAGASVDPVLATNSFIHMASNVIANNDFGAALNENLAKVTDNTSPSYDHGVASYASNQVEKFKHPPQTPIVNTINSLGYMMALGAVPVFALVQTTQPITTLVPTLKAAYGFKGAMAAWWHGQKLAAKLLSDETFKDVLAKQLPSELGEKPTNEVIATLSKILDKNKGEILRVAKGDKNMAELLRNTLLSSLGVALTNGSLRPSATNDLMEAAGMLAKTKVAAGKAMMMPASISETYNRLTAIFAYPMAAIASGQAVEFAGKEGRKMKPIPAEPNLEVMPDLIKTGDQINTIVNFVVTRPNKAPFQTSSNPVIKTASLFKNYLAQYAHLMHFNGLMEARRTKTLGSSNAKAALEYVKARFGYDLAAAAIGGPQAALDVMAIGAALALVGKMFDFDPEEVINNYLIKPVANAAKDAAVNLGADEKDAKLVYDRTKYGLTNGGISALTGIDISAAVRPDLLASSGSESAREKAFNFTAGPIIAGGFKTGEEFSKKGIAAMKALEPRVAKGITEAVTGEAKVGMSPVKLTPYQRLLRALSAQPTDLAIERKKESEVYDFRGQYKELKDRLQNKINQTIGADGKPDVETIRSANRELRRFEADNIENMRKFKITPAQKLEPFNVKRETKRREGQD